MKDHYEIYTVIYCRCGEEFDDTQEFNEHLQQKSVQTG